MNPTARGSLLGSDADLVERRLPGSDDAGFEEVKLAAAVHLAFDEFGLGDLSFRLTVGPR